MPPGCSQYGQKRIKGLGACSDRLFSVMLEILWTLYTCIPLFKGRVFRMTTKFSCMQRNARTLSIFMPARLRRHGCGARQFITVPAKQTNETQSKLDEDDVRGNQMANSLFLELST